MEKFVCLYCVKNHDFISYIEKHDNHSNKKCAYCEYENLEDEGNYYSIPIEKFAEYLLDYIKKYYEENHFAFKDAREHFSEDISDTREVLYEIDVSDNDKLIEDLLVFLPESDWTSNSFFDEEYSMKPENTLILVGNGINLATCENCFKLKEGMAYAWGKIDKKLRDFIRAISQHKPDAEKQLRSIQDNIFTINKMRSINEKLHHLLKSELKEIKKFRADYNKYLTLIADYFFQQSIISLDAGKYSKLLDNLENFIRENHSENSRTHIATLNYDAALYLGLLRKDILRDSYDDTHLSDGFSGKKHNIKFKEENLYRHNSYGWYMHLHGSPLFYAIEDSTYKDHIEDYIGDDKNRNHIIACCPSQKYETIFQSEILRTYIDCFKRAITEAKNIILIGYSGNDVHINDMLSLFSTEGSKLIVIDHKNRREYWEKKLKKFNHKDAFYEVIPNILETDFIKLISKIQNGVHAKSY